jgi:hypothetical protein
MQPGRPLQLSSYRSDGALSVSTKRAAINREGEEQGNAVQDDVGHHQLDMFIYAAHWRLAERYYTTYDTATRPTK